MKNLLNVSASTILKGFKAQVSDTLPVGEHLVTIMEFFLKEPEKDQLKIQERGYIDETLQFVCYMQNEEGRLAHYFSLGAYESYDDVCTNSDYWLEQVDLEDINMTAAKWKKLSKQTKFEMAFTSGGKYAIYKSKNGYSRILNPKKLEAARQILSRFVGAAIGGAYELSEGLDANAAIERLSTDLKGCQLYINVVAGEDGDNKMSIKKFRSHKA